MFVNFIFKVSLGFYGSDLTFGTPATIVQVCLWGMRGHRKQKEPPSVPNKLSALLAAQSCCVVGPGERGDQSQVLGTPCEVPSH
jgi:hypothetical protein